MSEVKVSAERLMEAASVIVATAKMLPNAKSIYYIQLADYFITQIGDQLSDEQIAKAKMKVKDNTQWLVN